ncbi:hypothetical protein [Actinomarinicola tropica]|uniref:hypothetical protein n=1 Tax=Actinomarinicola tropica TaxID=2789776 RepID=UPI001896C74F|nr:hypothetical protein [Actinomarinicola tropica]
MTAAVVVLALLSGLLAVLLLVQRRRSTAALDACRADAGLVADELAATRSNAADTERRAAEAEARAEAAERRAADAEASAAATRADADRASGDREAALASLAAAEDQIAAAQATAAAATTERDEVAAQVVELRERLLALDAASRRTLDAHRPGIEAEALWQLELARAERTWRHSVAASPDGPGPFGETDDPLRTAVEIEVAALREEVGVAMEVDWDATVDDPARCLTVLRLTQELLAAAAREQQAIVLRAHEEGGEVVLVLSVPEGNPPLEIEVPPLAEHLVSVRSGDDLRVAVR